jgi:ATP-dependent RNA helicase DDX49/DBP8
VLIDVPLLRELAFQIADQFAVLGAPLNVRTAVVVGGMDMMAQAIELERRPHVVVATPGRMVDHLRSTSGDWSLSRVRFLVCSFNPCRSVVDSHFS